MIEQTVRKHGTSSVMVSSFTKAAAEEITSRAAGIDPDQIGTLHSLCFRALERPKIATGTALKSWNEEHPTFAQGGGLAQVDNPYWDPFGRDVANLGDDLAQQADRLRSKMVPQTAWPTRLREFWSLWEGWKAENDLCDFTDLISDALFHEIDPPGRATIGFFDEVQDCSPLEMALIRHWAEKLEGGIMLAGDPAQSIFGFRGASPRSFLEPALPESNVRHLTQSYRLPRAVHALSMRCISRTSYKVSSEFAPRDADGSVRQVAASSKMPFPIVDEIESGIDGTVMILAPCAFMLNTTIEVLRAKGIPYHNPYRPTNGKWNPRGGALDRLRSFLRPENNGGNWYWHEVERFVSWISSTHLPHGAKAEVKRRAEAEGQIQKPSQPYRSQLIEVLGEQFVTGALDAIATGKAANYFADHAMGAKARQLQYASSLYNCGRLEEPPRVIVGTVHSVKGGQASRVYLIPELSKAGMMHFRYGTPDERDEVLRMLYVGVTRARDDLVICTGQQAKNVLGMGEVF